MTAIPPFARIAQALRERIERGELPAGARLPSTRALAARHRVALATATKAIEALKHEGRVVGVPRVGVVVAPEPAASAARRARPARELGRAPIVRAAIELADAEGFAAVSMRSVAVKLGAPVMSLYRHVVDKDDLVTAMIDAAMAEAALPATPPSGWRAQIEQIMRLEWALYRRHPWLARGLSLTRPQLIPSGMRHTERVLRAVSRFGLDATALLHVNLTTIGFVRGVAINLEDEADAEAESGVTSDEWMARRGGAFDDVFAAGDFPMLAQLAASPEVKVDLDSLFEFGMARVLDGLSLFLRRGA